MHFKRRMSPERPVQTQETRETHEVRLAMKSLFSKPLKEAWPETRVNILTVAAELRKRADNWDQYRNEEKPQYLNPPIVTPESKRNRAALLERAVLLMDDYLSRHPATLNDCIELHSYVPGVETVTEAGVNDFLCERIINVPGSDALQACSRGGYLVYAGNERKPQDGPEEDDCIVIAGAPEGGGGVLKLISPCWGQEEQAFMQIVALFIALYGKGFMTRLMKQGTGNPMEITPVLVTNVVPLATLGSRALTTRKPEATVDKDGNTVPPDFSTSVFHASEAQFKVEAALRPKDGNKTKALFYSFTDMRQRYKDGDLVYRIEDLRDMGTSVGKAVRLWAHNTPPKQKLHAVGVGTGIYEHAECVSAAMTLMMLALNGREGRLYYGEAAFAAAQEMVGKVFEAMRLKAPPAQGFTVDDYVQELGVQIGQLDEQNKVHWQIGGLKKGRSNRANTTQPTVQKEPSPVSTGLGATQPMGIKV